MTKSEKWKKRAVYNNKGLTTYEYKWKFKNTM